MSRSRSKQANTQSPENLGSAPEGGVTPPWNEAQGQAGGGNAMVAERISQGETGSAGGVEGDLALLGAQFGADFSDVRVDAAADPTAADALGASAWTSGRRVSFRPGEYVPGTPEGQELLAHELTHVLQQGSRPQEAGWVKTAAREASGHLDTVEELLEQALVGLENGRLDGAVVDGSEVAVDRARAPLMQAQAQLRALRSPDRARDAADLSILLLEAADHEEAREAARTAETLHDVDTGPDDSLERQAESSARQAAAGRPVGPVQAQSDAPRAQRMAQAVALPLILGPPGWVLAAVAALGLVVVAYAAYDANRPFDQMEPTVRDKPTAQPKPMPWGVPTTLEKDEPKRRDWGMMRFQVQWNTRGGGPTFSESVAASSELGVTVVQAVAGMNAALAQVTPRAAGKAAAVGVAAANAWILKRPPLGIAQGGYSKSFRFQYGGFSDARADVENIKGHNLRT